METKEANDRKFDVGRWRTGLALLFILAVLSQANNYHVTPSGLAPVGSSGTFVSLASAEASAVAGDTVWLHAGTYRSALKPANSGTPGSPIVFIAYPGDAPLLTGLDSIGGWTLGSNAIWSAPVAGQVTQLFQDRIPMPEARFPNTGRDLFHPATIPLTMDSATLSSDALPSMDGSWNGATVWAMIGSRWVSQSATVSGVSPGSIAIAGNSYASNTGDGIGYIGGVLAALDTAGEWVWHGDSVQFLPDSGKSPGQVLIEGKTRAWAVDLSSRTDIVVQGLQVFAGGANLDKSKRCRLERLSMRYLSHFISTVTGSYISSWTRWAGIDINAPGIGVGVFGDSNTVDGCDIQWSAGDGITLYGNGNLVQNNTISDVDYAGADDNGISIYGNGNRITRNTVDTCGRGCVFLFGGGTERIDHNLVFDNGRVNWDVGGIYMFGVDGQGSSIDHNWVHDSHSTDPDNLGMGIYIDNFNSNTSIHHNVVWNCDYSALNYSRPAVSITWANNTVFAARNVTYSYLYTGAPDTSRNNRLWNNLMTAKYGTDPTFGALDQSHDITLANLSLRDPSHFDFRPLPGSPAIDAGVSIPGIDDSIVGGAPDAGAYELGGLFWKAGAGSADSGAVTAIVPKGRIPRTAWRVSGTVIHAEGACDLRVSDLSGRQLGRLHLEAGQSLDLAAGEHGLAWIDDGHTVRSILLER